MREFFREKQKILLGALGIFFIAGIIVLSVNIHEVTITGNERYSDTEIVDMILEKKWDWNSAFCYLKDHIADDHKDIPFVEDYKLVFLSPVHLEIIVHEKAVVGYVSYMSSYMYFDKDGIIVESTNEQREDVPKITGLKFGQIVLHQPLPVESDSVFESILNLTQMLEVYDIKVDTIQYNNRNEATLYMGDIEVFLGSAADTSGKIAELADMLPTLEGKSGILYLDTYDPTNDSMMYTFKKR